MLNECNGCEYKCSLSHIDICTLGSPCPHQRSTLMTNEEWFCNLSTEEKAEFMGDIWGRGYLKGHFEGNFEFGEKQDKAYWEMWLKEKHNG